MQKKDFYISYAKKDKKWATWIAGVLEVDGYTVTIEAWDFLPGENKVLNIHNALIDCERFIAVLSAEYMKKVYCRAEWSAALTKDPAGEKSLFIPIRIEDCNLEGLLASIIPIDLFGVDEKEAEERMKQVNVEGMARNKPDFPGTKKPIFPGQLPLNNIPFNENHHFTGRKKILDGLAKSLKPGQKNPYSIALCGMGAVGKTQIALAYLMDSGYLYDTIWWVNAENALGILNSYKELLGRKGNIDKDSVFEKKEILESIWAWMSQNPNWLFIYDNAEEEKDLAEYLPRCNTGHILFTSRNPHWLNVNETVEVHAFHPTEALELLEGFTKRKDVGNGITLAKALGYLPLALAQAAAYMVATDTSYEDYLDIFNQYRLKIFETAGSRPSAYKETVTTTWNLSLDKINDEGARQLIKLCAFLNPDSINLGKR